MHLDLWSSSPSNTGIHSEAKIQIKTENRPRSMVEVMEAVFRAILPSHTQIYTTLSTHEHALPAASLRLAPLSILHIHSVWEVIQPGIRASSFTFLCQLAG